jgi:hypothetical protein
MDEFTGVMQSHGPGTSTISGSKVRILSRDGTPRFIDVDDFGNA